LGLWVTLKILLFGLRLGYSKAHERYGKAKIQTQEHPRRNALMNMNAEPASTDPLDLLDDAHAAQAFRRLVRHLRYRHDVQNIDLMGHSGFCRNCLADWIVAAGAPLDKAAAREAIHGLPADEWKSRYQTEATPQQLARMKESVAKNAPDH